MKLVEAGNFSTTPVSKRTPKRIAAVLNLYLQCYTQEEIAEQIGMPQQTVGDLLPRIRKYEIPVIPGLFAEDLPDDSAEDKKKKSLPY